MKKIFLLPALLAAGLFAVSCSSSEEDEGTVVAPDNGGENYIAININLPTDPATTTRAGDDNAGEVIYDDGNEEEYKVFDAALIVFDATSLSFKKAYDLSKENFTNTGTGEKNVTAYNTKIIQLVGSNVKAGDLALVILNRNGLIEVQSDNTLKVYDNTSNALAAFTGTFSDFQKKLAKTNTDQTTVPMISASGGFYMANAPLANKQGSTTEALPTATEARTLVPISTVYKTYAAAEAGTADQIYVERGMAKVTVGGENGTLTNTKVTDPTTPADLKYKLTGWALDNTNKTSYLVRSTEGHSEFLELVTQKSGGVYRYVGNTPITYPTMPSHPYRTYFAKGTNYKDTPDGLNTYSTVSWKTGDDIAKPSYCYEHTFPVAAQTVKNTTLVQIELQVAENLDDPKDLYSINGNKSLVYNETKLLGKIQEEVYNYLSAKGYTKSDFGTGDISVDKDKFSVATETNKVTFTTGAIKFTDVSKLTKECYDSNKNFNELSDFQNYIKEIVKYDGGKSYYNVRIKHFGDVLTPWNNGEFGTGTAPANYTSSDNTTAAKIAKIYPDNSGNQNKNYLGRYGVLRNNWYNITVTSVDYLGDAVPHTGVWPDTPDDEIDSYIVFQINILSWAKREQSADL